jgi:hypothetical protein
MVVQVPQLEIENLERYVAVAVTGYFNPDGKNVVYLGYDQPDSLVPEMGHAFGLVVGDDSQDEPVDVRTPDDPFGS